MVLPAAFLKLVDSYARELKAATRVGGIITLLAFGAAMGYTGWLVAGYLQLPPTVDSSVQWADTNGPWPMEIRCVASGGCWISNTHNKWSSNGDKVAAEQQSCFYLNQGQEYTINFTFTQDPHAGLILAWASADNSSSAPGSGVTVRADTNCPSCPGGVFSLWTPALGGTYLANLIDTHNHTSKEAPFRREWFLTYVSEGSGLQPWAPCWASIAAADRANFTQSNIRIMSAWYNVSIHNQDSWLQLLGTIGGAVSVCLSGGGLVLMVIEFIWRWIAKQHGSMRTAHYSSSGGGVSDAQLPPPSPPAVLKIAGPKPQSSLKPISARARDSEEVGIILPEPARPPRQIVVDAWGLGER